MRTVLFTVLVLVMYVLHQDLWFWRVARPLVLGFLPIGLFFHIAYTVASSVLMWLLVKYAWPGHLEKAPDLAEAKRRRVGPTKDRR